MRQKQFCLVLLPPPPAASSNHCMRVWPPLRKKEPRTHILHVPYVRAARKGCAASPPPFVEPWYVVCECLLRSTASHVCKAFTGGVARGLLQLQLERRRPINQIGRPPVALDCRALSSSMLGRARQCLVGYGQVAPPPFSQVLCVAPKAITTARSSIGVTRSVTHSIDRGHSIDHSLSEQPRQVAWPRHR